MSSNNKKKNIRIIVLTLLLVVVAGSVYYFFLMPEEVEEVSYQTSPLEFGDIQVVLENSGVIKYMEESDISSDITGTINNLYIDEDLYISDGDLILDIDTRSNNLNLEQSQVDLYLAKLNLADLLNTTIDSIDNVSINDLTTVFAPMNGVIEYNIEKGSVISSGANVMAITNSDQLNFIAKVPVNMIENLKIGDTTEVYVYNNYEYVEGKVTKISSVNKALNGEMINEVCITVINNGINEGMEGYARIYLNGNSIYSAEGAFENVAEASVIPNYSGTIEEIYVENGEYVTAGTPLLKIDSTSLENQIEQQKQTIYNKELNIQELLLNMEDTTVVTDVSGVVTDMYVKEGESINNGTKIASVVSDSLVATIDIDELDIGKVELGQEAKLIIPGYSEEEIIGTVSYIADTGNVLDGITTYDVHISFDSNDKIKEGMTVETTIIVDSATDVLKVPSSSVKTMNKRSMVQVLENGEVVMKPVEVGISDDFYTEIISGIDESVEIITSSGAAAVPVIGDMTEDEMMEMRDQMDNSGQKPAGGMGGFTGGGR